MFSTDIRSLIHDIKIVKLQGDFVWHEHKDTNEMFMAIEGELRIDFRDGYAVSSTPARRLANAPPRTTSGFSWRQGSPLLQLSPAAGAIVAAHDARIWLAESLVNTRVSHRLASWCGAPQKPEVSSISSRRPLIRERPELAGTYGNGRGLRSLERDEELGSLSNQAQVPYKIALMFLCRTDDAETKLTDLLSFRLQSFTKSDEHDRIFLLGKAS